MVRPQVVDGGNSIQLWRVAVNTLNKQLWTVDKGWSFTPRCKNNHVTNHSYKLWTWTDSLDKRQKMDMRFGIWNVRSLYRAGSLVKVLKKLSKYKLDLVGVQEV
jgi:hypothetical protein